MRTRSKCLWPRTSKWSKHSRRTLLTQRSAIALAFGGPDRRADHPEVSPAGRPWPGSGPAGSPTPSLDGGSPRVMDPSGRNLDEEDDVERLQRDRLDGEEIAGQDFGGLGLKERTPARVRSSGSMSEARPRRIERMVEGPPGSPACEARPGCGRIPRSGSPGQPDDHCPDLGIDRRPTGPSSPLTCPLPPDELLVPAEQRLGPDHEGAPPVAGDHPAGRGEHQSIEPPQVQAVRADDGGSGLHDAGRRSQARARRRWSLHRPSGGGAEGGGRRAGTSEHATSSAQL